MNCGVPFCQSAIELKGRVTGCPLHNLVPEWNEEIYQDNIAYALNRLLKTNPFPEFTGRVCPALCEKACLNGLEGLPVCIHDNEKFIIESAFDEGLMKPKIPAVRSSKGRHHRFWSERSCSCAYAQSKRSYRSCVWTRGYAWRSSHVRDPQHEAGKNDRGSKNTAHEAGRGRILYQYRGWQIGQLFWITRGIWRDRFMRGR